MSKRQQRFDMIMRANTGAVTGALLAFMLGLMWNVCTWQVAARGVATAVIVFVVFAFLAHIFVEPNRTDSDKRSENDNTDG